MAQFNYIDSDMWYSTTIQSYDCLQLAVFFYFHTRKEIPVSGVYKTNLFTDCALFKRPGDCAQLTKDDLLKVINSMPENLIYDSENSLIFCIQHFEHASKSRGNPKLVFKSVENSIRQYHKSLIWQHFIKKYPEFAEVAANICANIEQTLPNKQDSLPIVSRNFLESFDKLSYKYKYKYSFLGKGVWGETLLSANNLGLPFDDESLLLALFDFLEFRHKSGRTPTPESALALCRELDALSSHDSQTAINILNQSLAAGSFSIYPLKTGSAKSRNLPPQAPTPNKQASAQFKAKKQKLMDYAKTTTFKKSKFSEILEAFKNETPDIPKDIKLEDLVQNHFQSIADFISFHTPENIETKNLLVKLGISDPESISRLFTLIPTLSTNDIQPFLDSEHRLGSTEIISQLLHDLAVPLKTPDTEIFQTAKSRPLTPEEYKKIPEIHRTGFISTDHGKTFQLLKT
jgi:hypothetical protein